MRFAKAVFIIAGIWGIVVLTPLFFLMDITGREYPTPGTYPHFFFGFVAVAMAWQLAFLIIGSDPVRFRLMMIPAILEKLGYVGLVLVLYRQNRIPPEDASTAVPDLLLGLLFIAAFVRTARTPDRLRPPVA